MLFRLATSRPRGRPRSRLALPKWIWIILKIHAGKNDTCSVRTQDWCQIIRQVALSLWVYVINKLRSVDWRQRVLLVFYNHGQKSWDTCISMGFSNSHRSNPSPYRTNNIGRVYPEFFSLLQLCIGCVEGELQENFKKGCTILRGNRETTEKCEYCNTVPRTFVQDCRLSSTPNWKESICLQCREHTDKADKRKKLFDDTHDLRDSCAEIVYFSKIICRNCVDKSITLLKKVDLTQQSIIDTQVFFTREPSETVTKQGGATK